MHHLSPRPATSASATPHHCAPDLVQLHAQAVNTLRAALVQQHINLLLGSGNIVHNLRRLEWDNPNGSPQADRFDAFITGLVKKRDNEKIIHYEDNPDAAYAAPTADHFLPLLYTLGAAQGEKPEIFNNVRNTGSLSMTGYLFGFGEK